MTEDEDKRITNAVERSASKIGFFGNRCPKCDGEMIFVSQRVDGTDVWESTDYCKDCGEVAKDSVRPADSIPVVPHVEPKPAPAFEQVVEWAKALPKPADHHQPCAGARERYMRLPLETQMLTQSAYLSDALEYSPTYGRLSRDARKRLRMIQLDLIRWPDEILRLREELAAEKAMMDKAGRRELEAVQAMLDDVGSRYGYWQAFREWWNGK